MSGFFEPRPNQNCYPWGAKDSIWSTPYPFGIEDSSSETVAARLAMLFADIGLHVCAYSDIRPFVDVAIHPGGPGVKRYIITAILQTRIDPNDSAVSTTNADEEDNSDDQDFGAFEDLS